MVMMKKKSRKTITIKEEKNMTKNRYEGEDQLLQKNNST
jgi:hypothetical protein